MCAVLVTVRRLGGRKTRRAGSISLPPRGEPPCKRRYSALGAGRCGRVSAQRNANAAAGFTNRYRVEMRLARGCARMSVATSSAFCEPPAQPPRPAWSCSRPCPARAGSLRPDRSGHHRRGANAEFTRIEFAERSEPARPRRRVGDKVMSESARPRLRRLAPQVDPQGRAKGDQRPGRASPELVLT